MSTERSTSRNGKDPGRRAANIKHKQQRLLLLHHSANCSHKEDDETPCKATQHCAEMKNLWRHMEDCKEDRCRFPHCFSSRAILTHYSKCTNRICLTCEPVRSTLEGQSSSHRSASRIQLRHSKKQPGSIPAFHSIGRLRQDGVDNGRKVVVASPPPSPSPSPLGSSTDDVEKMTRTSNGEASLNSSLQAAARRPFNTAVPQKIRNKQQRLLLLWHASRCNDSGDCPITSHCATMKKLWEHIGICNKEQCKVPHCMSSRSILSHYQRCKDVRCLMCKPVRERIVLNARLRLNDGSQQEVRLLPQTAGAVRRRIIAPNEVVEISARRPAKRQKLITSQPAAVAGVTINDNASLRRYLSLCPHGCSSCNCASQWVQQQQEVPGYRRVPTCPTYRIDLPREDLKAILLQPATLRPTIIASPSGTEKNQDHEHN